jgi:RNA ligase
MSTESIHEAQHPATRYTYDELLHGLEQRVSAGLVRKTVCPDNEDLTLYCYTQRAVVERAWDDFVIVARGIVLDTARQQIAALPFPKFFNYGERADDAGLTGVPIDSVTEKVDGSLVIAFYDTRYRTWRTATKGSFTSPQAKRGLAEMKAAAPRGGYDPSLTYLFEVVYPEDRKVVKYDRAGLTLLSAYACDPRLNGFYGRETDELWCRTTALLLRIEYVATHDVTTLDEIAALAATLPAQREGFVVRFCNGARLKFKGSEYLRVHRLISNVTPLFVWEALRNHDNLAAIRADLPEEFWKDFDCIVAILRGQFETVVARVVEESKRHEHKTDKELGLSLKDVPTELRPYAFAPRKHGPKWFEQPKTWGTLWASIRPTGNVLEGYAQSSGLRAIQSEV